VDKAPKIVLASQNPGKCREFARILDSFQVLSLSDFPSVKFPEEGDDYQENARVKAETAAIAIGLPAVADDSGLEVDFLDGGPGAYSARFGGPGLDDHGRVDHLLSQLKSVPVPRRARFYCAAACVWPDGKIVRSEGICAGEIVLEPRGDQGFGYDPVFQADGEVRVMAELSVEEKDALSHRGKAFRALAKMIREMV